MDVPMIQITLKANSCTDNHNGTVTVTIPCNRDISFEERAMLEKLYPNLLDKAYDLMNKETLLASIATEADCAKKASDSPDNSSSDYVYTPKKNK